MKKLLMTIALVFIPVMTSFAQEQSELVSSETGVNYDRLADLLSQQQWRRANDQTFNLLLEASGRQTQGWLDLESYRTLPCSDLEIIDRLWVEYSGGHFGFSVQLPIFLETGNQPGRLIDETAFEEFGDRIGWRREGEWIFFKENLNFSLDSPEGHLPNPRQVYEISGNRLDFTTFAQRLVECKIGVSQ